MGGEEVGKSEIKEFFLPFRLPRYFSFQPNSHSLGRIFVSRQAFSEFKSKMALARSKCARLRLNSLAKIRLHCRLSVLMIRCHNKISIYRTWAITQHRSRDPSAKKVNCRLIRTIEDTGKCRLFTSKARNSCRLWINEWLQDYKTARVVKMDKCAKTLPEWALLLLTKKPKKKNKTKKKVECHVAQKHSTTSQRKAVF